jgi:hypothetical protein
MPYNFWKSIDWADPADDPFSLGLLQVPSRFLERWGESQLEALLSCDEERRARAASTESLAGTLGYDPSLRNGLPPTTKRKYRSRRDYLALLEKLDKALLHYAFEGWLSAVRDLMQEHFQIVFEIAAANRNRTRGDDPQEFAYQFMHSLIEGAGKKPIDLTPDDFLLNFFRNPTARSQEAKHTLADMLSLLRELLRSALFRNFRALSSEAQINLAMRGWTKETTPTLGWSEESEATPKPQGTVVAKLDDAAGVTSLRLRDLEERPKQMSARDVVLELFPHLKLTIKDARYYVVEEQKKNHHPSPGEISGKFPLLADAPGSEIEKYVIHRTTRRSK